MQIQFVWYMNEENRITQYEVIVKNVIPYSKKALLTVESMCSLTGRTFLFHHCTLARNAVLDTPETKK